MSLYISILGIDGSGKSTVTAALAAWLPRELGVTIATIGDDFLGGAPAEDGTVPRVEPIRRTAAASLARMFRRGAKATTEYRRLYPFLKLGHLAFQEGAARQIARRYRPELLLCDGSLMLSAAGRAVNYRKACASASHPDPLSSIEALYEHVIERKGSAPPLAASLPGVRLMRQVRWLDQRLGLGIFELPNAVVFLDVAPDAALSRLIARGRKLDRHENLRDLTAAQNMYRGAVEFFRRRRGEKRALVLDATTLSLEETVAGITDFLRPLCGRPPAKALRPCAAGLTSGQPEARLAA